MFGLAGLLGLMMIGTAVDFGDVIGKSSDEDDTADRDDDLSPDRDTLAGADDPNSIMAMLGDGNDVAQGGGVDDNLDGGPGDDLINGGDGDDILSGGPGDDELHGEADDDRLSGGDGDDDLYGHAGDDLLRGDDGDDWLIGGEGDDDIAGGQGDDSLMGGFGDDTVSGGTGADIVNGNDGDDHLSGLDEAGQDDGTTDFLNGGNGDDTLLLGAGDNAHGGAGSDTFTLGDWIEDGSTAVIEDYDAAEDALVVLYDDVAHPDPELTVEADPENGSATLLMDGLPMATLTNPVGLDLADITLIPASSAAAEMAIAA